jgi:DNA-binding PadR family transcriptional regulator
MNTEQHQFAGFELPESNFSKLPHSIVDAFPNFTSLGEVLCTLYVLRHTWGFNDDSKRISLDEFMNGRKVRNRATGEIERLDHGVGLSKTTVIRGIRKAVAHGFLRIETDDSDPGRIEKTYSIRTKPPGSEVLLPQFPSATPPVANRNTEHRKKLKKETKERQDSPDGEKVSKPRKADPYYDAIALVFNRHGSQNGLIRGLLTGTAKQKGWKEHNLEEPINDPQELLDWYEWYDAQQDDDDYIMIQKPALINSSITGWQNAGRPRVIASRFSLMIPEDADAETEAQIREEALQRRLQAEQVEQGPDIDEDIEGDEGQRHSVEADLAKFAVRRFEL